MELFLDRIKSERDPLSPGFLQSLKGILPFDTFVETGTYLGATAAAAAQFCRAVFTIELSGELAARAAQRFAGSAVTVLQGDSAHVLPALAGKLREPVLFWLDGHFSGSGTAQGSGNTPILGELEAIGSLGLKQWIILVDDLRLFHPGNPELHATHRGYPSVEKVFSVVRDMAPDASCAVFGDVAIAVSPGDAVRFSPLLNALTLSRAFAGPEEKIQDALAAEETIARAAGREREALLSLPADYPAGEKFGIGAHYRLWRGLVLENDGNREQAGRDYFEAIAMRFHWRAKWYCARNLFRAGRPGQALELVNMAAREAPFFEPLRAFAAQCGAKQ
jgi:hypothetical protein